MFNTLSLPELSFLTWKAFTGIINYLPDMIKLKLNEPHLKWRLTVVQSECKIKLNYHVADCIFE